MVFNYYPSTDFDVKSNFFLSFSLGRRRNPLPAIIISGAAFKESKKGYHPLLRLDNKKGRVIGKYPLEEFAERVAG